jgi:lysophospholipase L1-like esterase
VRPERVLLVGLGDSLTHGTMDATNNSVNTQHAYLQKVADKLAEVVRLRFTQPLYDFQEERMDPFSIPTNLGVDGSDSFALEGLDYYKRAGAAVSVVSRGLICDPRLPRRLTDDYDKVLFPINLLAGKAVSQLDAAVWQLTQGAARARADKALVVLWIGNNDSSTAALGVGGANPEFQPIPFGQIRSELRPGLRYLLRYGALTGAVSFEPYLQSSLERNLTDLADFTAQFDRVLTRLTTEAAGSSTESHFLVLTLPYYSAIGYLMDSEDLEFYLRKFDSGYTVPPSFQRVAPPGEPVTDPFRGDRISLLTFGFMVSLLATGHTTEEVNQVLEQRGRQRDGLVLSEDEARFIMSRIDGFNEAIRAVAAARGPRVHVVDVGGALNRALSGQDPVVIGGRAFGRKWSRGGAFSLDGVHPGYTGQAFIANLVLEDINRIFGWSASTYDLAEVLPSDPYVDHDGDGWVPGPLHSAQGITELLFLLKDPDDAAGAKQVEIPPDVWDRISAVLLQQVLDVPTVAREAERLGIR